MYSFNLSCPIVMKFEIFLIDFHIILKYHISLSSVDLASLYNLANETNLVHNFFSVYFVNVIYNLYTFHTSPGQTSGGTDVFYVLLGTCVLYSCLSGIQDGINT